MSDITKKVSHAVPSQQRTQNFADEDATQGDILLIKDSLGRPAHYALVEALTGAMELRFNVYHTIYPRRLIENEGGLMHTDHLPFVASGHQIKDNTQGSIDIQNGEAIEFMTFPISDIELVVASGHFNIFVA
jgi:hypothetical protein